MKLVAFLWVETSIGHGSWRCPQIATLQVASSISGEQAHQWACAEVDILGRKALSQGIQKYDWHFQEGLDETHAASQTK